MKAPGSMGPATWLASSFVLFALLVGATLLAAARLPSLRSEPDSEGLVQVIAPTRDASLVALEGGGEGPVRVSSLDVIDPDLLAPSNRQLARMATLSRMAASDTAKAHVAVANGVEIRPVSMHHVGLAGVPAEAWAIIGLTGLCAVIGSWVVATQRRRWANVMVGCSGLSLLLAGLPVAFALSVEWLVVPWMIVAAVWTNLLAAWLFSFSLVGLFARHPAPLLGWRSLATIDGMFSVVMILALTAPDFEDGVKTATLFVVATVICIAALAFAQWRRAKADPIAMVYLRWVGSVMVVCAAAYAVLFSVPLALEAEPLVGTAASFALFLPFYLALIAGVLRFRILDLDRWSLALVLGAGATVLVLAVDALLIVAFNLAPGRAGALAISVAAVAWIAVRDKARDWIGRNARREPRAQLTIAVGVAMAAEPQERQRRWRDTLIELFQPLRVEAGLDADRSVRVEADGLTLVVPDIDAVAVLRLHMARGGHRLFGRDDARLAGELVALSGIVDDGRRAFERGVSSERGRIARDLHDDVASHLLTGLHRAEPDLVRADVRSALAEMREIVAGLVSDGTTLAACLAAIRHEAAERLDAFGQSLKWRTEEIEDRRLDARTAKATTSAVRELVTNAIRHAGGTHVTVIVDAAGDDVLRLTVQDDGIGLDGRSPTPRRGLGNVASRMTELGGSMTLSGPSPGSTIVLMVPLPRNGACGLPSARLG